MHKQPGARPVTAEEAAPGTCQSYDLGLAASLTWSCHSGITVLALQQYGDARCGPPTVCDWGPQLAAQAGPGKGHRNNFKCSTSGLKVFSCYAAAMMFAMRYVTSLAHTWIFLSKFIKTEVWF